MNPTDAIIGGTVVITGLAVVRDASAGHPSVRPIVSGFLLGTTLLLVSFVSPTLAKWLALMGVLGSVLVNGPGVFRTVGKLGAH